MLKYYFSDCIYLKEATLCKMYYRWLYIFVLSEIVGVAYKLTLGKASSSTNIGL